MTYKLGIAFSGGGLRGVAHAGVLAALAEHDLEPECISGTSSGAIVGAFYAGGLSPAGIVEFFRHHGPFRLSKLSLSKPGLIDSDKIRSDFVEYFPADSFEALGKHLFVTATDILAGRPAIFSSGPLISAILASASMPPIFSPIAIDGRLYADGGIVNNFPVERLSGLCDVIVGSYAGPLRPVEPEDVDSTFAVAERALDIGIFLASRAKFHQCDVLLCPKELSRFGTLDSRHIDEIFEIGYRAANKKIDDIREALAARE